LQKDQYQQMSSKNWLKVYLKDADGKGVWDLRDDGVGRTNYPTFSLLGERAQVYIQRDGNAK